MDAERQTHVPFDLFVGEIFRTTFALIGDVEGPLFAVRAPMVGPHRHEHRHFANRGTPDPTNQHVRISRELGQVGRNIRGSGLRDHTQALVADTRHPRNGATPIATKQVARPHSILGARIMVLDPRTDTVAILLQPDEFMVKPDPAWIELLGTSLHDRFETNLRKIGAAAGAGLHPIEIRVSAAPALDFADQPAEIRVRAGEASIPGHRAHILGGRALGIDRLGDADIAEYFHSALIQPVCLGQDRRSRQRGYENVLDAKRRQQHRRCQSGASAAYDQNRRFIAHEHSLSLLVLSTSLPDVAGKQMSLVALSYSEGFSWRTSTCGEVVAELGSPAVQLVEHPATG